MMEGLRCVSIEADLHATGSAVAATGASANEMQAAALILGGGGQGCMRFETIVKE